MLHNSFTREELLILQGAELPVGPSWPAPKLRWLRNHREGMLENAKYWIQPKDWVIWKLTHEWRTDLSSLRGLVNQRNGSNCKPILDWAGVSEDILPEIDEPYRIVGPIGKEAAALLGLPEGIPVILGWNDLNASVLGTVGLSQEVCGFDITGTSEHLGIIQPFVSSFSKPMESGLNWIPFLGSHQMVYGVTSSGGQALKWYIEQIDQFDEESPSFDKAIQMASVVQPGSEGVFFLPYLLGERSPWWDPNLRGVFFGLHLSHDRRHMLRSVLEGVGYTLRAISVRQETLPKVIRVSGGASQIAIWNQIKANILGVPIMTLETPEAGCLGAAIMAAYGMGWYGSLEEACDHMIRIKEFVEPDSKQQAIYEDGYHFFIELYETVKPLFNRMKNTGDRDWKPLFLEEEK